MKIKIIVTDIDGVVFDIQSSWREFHKNLGTYDLKRLESLRRKYLEGKISYKEWADEEVKVWKGLPYENVASICKNFPFVKGARETFEELKKRGYYLAAVSAGGLYRIVKERLEPLGFDEIYSNDLEERNGILTGNFILNVEHNKKHEIVEKILKKKKLSWKECAVVGDDINDRSILRKAGFKIAFCPRDEKLIRKADVVIGEKDLRKILDYF